MASEGAAHKQGAFLTAMLYAVLNWWNGTPLVGHSGVSSQRFTGDTADCAVRAQTD